MKRKDKDLGRHLNDIHIRIHKGGLVIKAEKEKYARHVITTYVTDTNLDERLNITIGETTIELKVKPQTSVYCLTSLKLKGKMQDLIEFPNFSKIPEKDARDTLRTIYSPYVALPTLLPLKIAKRIAEDELGWSYIGAYIIREKWSKSLCSLPKCDNQIKSYLNAEANVWLTVANLCMKCRDLLPKQDLQKYPRSWDWLGEIVKECRVNSYRTIVGSQENIFASKKDYICSIRDTANVLSTREINPIELEISPRLHQLIDISLKIPYGSFCQEYWNPYITSLRKWAAALEKSNSVKFNPISPWH